MNDLRKETESLGEVNLPAGRLRDVAVVLKVDNVPQPAAQAPAAANRA
ncbi:hypothetical protein WHZ77_06340 [Bradyrhizobium sp. A5]